MSFIETCKKQQRSSVRAAWKSWPPEVCKEIDDLIKAIRSGKAPRFSRSAVLRAMHDEFGLKTAENSFRLYLRDNHGSESWDVVLDAKK